MDSNIIPNTFYYFDLGIFMKKLIASISVLLLGFTNSTLGGEFSSGVATVSLGAIQKGVESEQYLLPYFEYKSNNFSVDVQSIKYSLYEESAINVNLLGQFRFDGYETNDSAFLAGMKDRDNAFELGANLTYQSKWGEIGATFLNDVSNAYQGSEILLSFNKKYFYQKMVFIPEIGVSKQSSALVDYYYGVMESETNSERIAYKGKSTTNLNFSLMALYMLNEKTKFLMGIQSTKYGNKISNSPIVNRSSKSDAFAAVIYSF